MNQAGQAGKEEDSGTEDHAAGQSRAPSSGSQDQNVKKEEPPKGPPVYKRRGFLITISVVGGVLLVGGIVIWLIVRQFVSTDDAYVDGHVEQISPQISALVARLDIEDNQLVRRGDLLVELDPTDYRIALQESRAQVESSQGRLQAARAQVATAHATVVQTAAEVDAMQVLLDNASRDLDRYQHVDERARSKEQLDNAETAQRNAAAQLEQARARKVSAEANVTNAEASVQSGEGDLHLAEANQMRAETNLAYCKIFAPGDGRITLRTVEVGNYVVPGQALFMIVNPDVWVTANFKETQLTHMRPGQPVTIKVDAFPGVKFHGHVDSIQAGSGSRFAVLPAENATGNFVKVVQRVPVKIVFDHDANTNNAPMLSPGLSVVPRVKVR